MNAEKNPQVIENCRDKSCNYNTYIRNARNSAMIKAARPLSGASTARRTRQQLLPPHERKISVALHQGIVKVPVPTTLATALPEESPLSRWQGRRSLPAPDITAHNSHGVQEISHPDFLQHGSRKTNRKCSWRRHRGVLKIPSVSDTSGILPAQRVPLCPRFPESTGL